MGIESDQVVYEYLSRVGDVAQQRQLSSATRMRLVADLRDEIDRRRARAPVDSPAAVRRILSRLGTPDEVVAAASGERPAVPQERTPSVPVQRDGEGERPDGGRKAKGNWWGVPRPRSDAPPPAAPDVPSPPHRAGAHELGDSTETPDWWRRGSDPFGLGDEVPGFVGGIEIPDMLRPPPAKGPKDPGKEAAADAAGDVAGAEKVGAEKAGAPARGRLLSFLGGGRRWTNPLLLAAAGCLAVGAVIEEWLVMAVGWFIAYASRRLTERETKWAVMVIPGAAVAAGVLWLWGRGEGRWGEPVAEGQMNDAVGATVPWVVRGAAVASALFLLWRSQRKK